jgi:hypothetical protein
VVVVNVTMSPEFDQLDIAAVGIESLLAKK